MRRELAALAEQIEAVEMRRWGAGDVGQAVATGFEEVDRALARGGLLRGAVHEWLGPDEDRREWRPAFSILMHLAGRCAGKRRVVWVGERAWPYGHALSRAGLLERSLLVDARTAGERVWAAEVALRSQGVACVVADASGLDRVAVRRLQLSAEAGDAVGLLARPGSEAGEISSAATRWVVERAAGGGVRQRWTVHLLRCKGVQPTLGPRAWTLERDHATGAFCVPPALADRPAHPASRALRAG